MATQWKMGNIAAGVLAFVLWLVTGGLGLEGIYIVHQIFLLIYTYLGGNLRTVEMLSLILVFLMGLALLLFVIGTAEYHRKRVGRPESWRLFGWTIAAELSIVVLYYILV